MIDKINLKIDSMEPRIKVWAQMFFDDGSVTQGIYVDEAIYEDLLESQRRIAMDFLDDTGRSEGVLMIWGGGQIHVRKAKKFKVRFGSMQGEYMIKLQRVL